MPPTYLHSSTLTLAHTHSSTLPFLGARALLDARPPLSCLCSGPLSTGWLVGCRHHAARCSWAQRVCLWSSLVTVTRPHIECDKAIKCFWSRPLGALWGFLSHKWAPPYPIPCHHLSSPRLPGAPSGEKGEPFVSGEEGGVWAQQLSLLPMGVCRCGWASLGLSVQA